MLTVEDIIKILVPMMIGTFTIIWFFIKSFIKKNEDNFNLLKSLEIKAVRLGDAIAHIEGDKEAMILGLEKISDDIDGFRREVSDKFESINLALVQRDVEFTMLDKRIDVLEKEVKDIRMNSK